MSFASGLRSLILGYVNRRSVKILITVKKQVVAVNIII
jgi:hypothetical protein